MRYLIGVDRHVSYKGSMVLDVPPYISQTQLLNIVKEAEDLSARDNNMFSFLDTLTAHGINIIDYDDGNRVLEMKTGNLKTMEDKPNEA